MNYFSNDSLKQIFFKRKRYPQFIGSRESSWLEFKENFSFGDLADYARTMAAFANNNGGYIIFGIKDNPREIKGVDIQKFESIEIAKLTEGLNEIFSPEIEWELGIFRWENKDFGLIYANQSIQKPVVSRKVYGQEIKEADIFYRYHGRTERIKFPELSKIISERLEKEKQAWMDVLKRTAVIGPQNVALMDTLKGTIEGSGGTVLIDEELLPKLKFIKKGEFDEEKGAPTLKLVGELKSAPVTALRERQILLGTDIYRFRPQSVCNEVSRKIGKVFRPGSEHIKAWQKHKVRPFKKPTTLPYKNEYCEYKEADGYRYSQAWIDFLVNMYSKEGEYQTLVDYTLNQN